jgi:hypothetical protein
VYEISNNTGRFCIECKKELGYLNPEIRTFYKGGFIKTQSAFSDKLHPKFNKKRQRCFDCAYKKFNNINYRPNISHSEYAGYLFDCDVDTSIVAITLENMIKKYGEIDGKLRFDDYRNKQAFSNSYEYKSKKYGWSKQKFENFNKSRAITLENMIKKYGEIDGKLRFDDYRKRQSYTNTLEYFVEKYGYNKGKQEYDRICSEKSITLDNMIRIYGPEIGPTKYEAFITSTSQIKGYSKISQELFWEIENKITDYSYFAEKNNEFAFVHHNGCYLFNFVIPTNKKIIEFNGDYWHANPAIYESSWVNKNSNLTAEEIWKYDRDKNRFAENMGYSVFVVWENDYRKNKDEIINKCLEFLNEN